MGSEQALFDAPWYLSTNPDVAAAGIDPWAHFLEHGWREGRDPHPLFDSDWYRWRYEDVAAAGVNPWLHFLASGAGELRRPNPVFDPDWYLRAYPQVRGMDPFTHYVTMGGDLGWYSSEAAQLAAAQPSRPASAAGGDAPKVTVVVFPVEDWVHLHRCLRALATTDIPEFGRVVVIGDRKSELRKDRLEIYPWVHLVEGDGEPIPALAEPDFMVLLRGTSEPMPGFLPSLLAGLTESDSPPDTIAVPRSLGSLSEVEAAPSGKVTLATTAACAIRSTAWPSVGEMISRVSRDRGSSALAELFAQASRVRETDAIVVDHQALRLERQAVAAARRGEHISAERSMASAVRFEASAERLSLLTRYRIAAGDFDAAEADLAAWRRLLESMPPDLYERQPRFVRSTHVFTSDVIDEGKLAGRTVLNSTHAVVQAAAVDEAVELVRSCPGCYAPAAGLVTVLTEKGIARATSRRPSDSPIPKVVVQGWFGDTPCPEDVRETSRSWPEMNPDYRHVSFDTNTATEWLTARFGEAVAQVFRGATPVVQSNLFRHAYLSVEGGVWADMDDEALAPIDELVAGRSLVAPIEPLGGLGDNFIAAAPRHPVVAACFAEALQNVREGFEESIWLAVGPGLFTRNVAQWVAENPERAQLGSDTVLVDSLSLSRYVGMWRPHAYKETEQSWDVEETRLWEGSRGENGEEQTPAAAKSKPLVARSPRQQRLIEQSNGKLLATSDITEGAPRRGLSSVLAIGFHPVEYVRKDGSPLSGPDLARIARTADDAGFSCLGVMDHLLQQGRRSPSDPMLECFTTLGFLAGQTSDIELMPLVAGVTYRNPVLLAKAATTLDVLSEGRSRLGIGAAWYQLEHQVFGFPFPRDGERLDMLEDTVRLVRQMWASEQGPFESNHFHVSQTIGSPPPVRPGGPPIVIGGGGERRTMRLVARHADACNLFLGESVGGPAVVQRKLRALRNFCVVEGREYDAIAKTGLYVDPVVTDRGSLSRLSDELLEYAELGIQEIFLTCPPGLEMCSFLTEVGERLMPLIGVPESRGLTR